MAALVMPRRPSPTVASSGSARAAPKRETSPQRERPPPTVSAAAGNRAAHAALAAPPRQSGRAAISTASTAGSDVGALPLSSASATRLFQPGPDYWISHEPDLGNLKYSELKDELNQIDEWESRQTATTPKLLRLQAVRERMRGEVAAREKRAAAGANKTPRRAAKPAVAATAQTGAKNDAMRPKVLREPNSIPASEQDAVQQYDEIIGYLQRGDVTAADRKRLQQELGYLAPLVTKHLSDRAVGRYGDVLQRALEVDSTKGDLQSQLTEAARRIDGIKPIRGQPGDNYLIHGHEMIVVPDAVADAIRANALVQLRQTVSAIAYANDEVLADHQEFIDRTYDKHPYVGAISMALSGENPLNWTEKLMPMVAASNQARNEFTTMQRAAQDPWETKRPDLLPMAEKVAAAQRHSDNARNYLDYKTGQVLGGTADAIAGLERLKTAGQIAASVAFTPAGNLVYGAAESTAVQLQEIHYGQRESLDPLAIGFDAASAYAGSKLGGLAGGGVGKGVLSLGGKSAPVWLRGLAWGAEAIVGGRVGAATTTATRLSLDRAVGRSDLSASQIARVAGGEAIDLQGAISDLGFAGLHRAVHGRPRGRSAGAAAAPRAEQGHATSSEAPASSPLAAERLGAGAAVAGVKAPVAEAPLAPKGATAAPGAARGEAGATPAGRAGGAGPAAKGKTPAKRPSKRKSASEIGPKGKAGKAPARQREAGPKTAGRPEIAGQPSGAPERGAPADRPAKNAPSGKRPAKKAAAPKPANRQPAKRATKGSKKTKSKPPPKTRSPADEIELTRLETIGERRRMVGGAPVEPEFHDLPEERGKTQRRGEKVPGRPEVSKRVKASLRANARKRFGRLMQDALRDPGKHTALTQEALKYLTPGQQARVRRTGKMPRDFEFHHLLSIADFPEFGDLAESGLSLPKEVHRQVGHGGDPTKPLEAATYIDPEALDRPGATIDPEAKKGHRVKARDIAEGRGATSEKRGGVDADLIKERQYELQRLRRRRDPQPGDAKRIERLEGEIATLKNLINANRSKGGAGRPPNQGGAPAAARTRSPATPTGETAPAPKTPAPKTPSPSARDEGTAPPAAASRAGSTVPDQPAAAARRPVASAKTKPSRTKPPAEPAAESAAAPRPVARRSATTPDVTPPKAAKQSGKAATPDNAQPTVQDPGAAPTKSGSPKQARPPSSRGERVAGALGKADAVLGAVRDYQQYVADGKSESAALTRAAVTLAANLKGGPAAGVVNAANAFDNARRAGQGKVEAMATAIGTAGGGVIAGKVAPTGPVGAAVNLANTAAQAFGAPQGVQDATSGAATLVPSNIVATTITEGARSYANLGTALVTGDTKAIDRQVQDFQAGNAGPWLQGYAQVTGMVADIAAGDSFDKALNKAADSGKGSWADRVGSKGGDGLYELGQSKEAKAGKYGSSVQGISMALGIGSDMVAGDSFEKALNKAAEAGKGSWTEKAGNALGDAAWDATEKVKQLAGTDLPAAKQLIKDKWHKLWK